MFKPMTTGLHSKWALEGDSHGPQISLAVLFRLCAVHRCSTSEFAISYVFGRDARVALAPVQQSLILA